MSFQAARKLKILQSILTQKQQQVVILYYSDGLTQEQIGKKIKTDQQGVSDILKSALKILAAHDLPKPKLFSPASTNAYANASIDELVKNKSGTIKFVRASSKPGDRILDD